jgi:signal transduction histidine kinase
MKKIILIILCLFINSCKKENSIQNNSSILTTNPFLEKAKLFRSKKLSDSAFIYFNLAKNSFLENNDSLGAGRALVNMAIIQTDNGDFLGGIETSLEAQKYIKQKQDSNVLKTLASNYNNLGIASNYLKNYDQSVKYYNEAIKNAVDKENKYVYYNNIGDILTTQGKYKEAIPYLEKAILADSIINHARALNNLAKAKYLLNKNYNPVPEFYQALEIRKKINDGEGQNSSYETLSTYYLDKDKTRSLNFAKMMLKAATNNKSPDDQMLALQRIISLEPATYLKNFNRLNTISDNIQTERNRNKNQFAIVRYDLEGERAKNQTLKAERAQQDNQILLLLMALVLSFAIIIWFRKRQIRLKQEKELEIKNTQLRLSKKVHDVVANGIYQVMTKIENQEHFDKVKALDELEFVYEKSRDISYEKSDDSIEEKNFSEKISELIGSFKNESVNTYIAGNEKSLWENISKNTENEVYQIIRELLVNMRKHSGASIVSFRFEKKEDVISISYSDNGIGISGDVLYKNGLSSTVSRIESIHGAIIFDTKTEKGLKINISFPVS